MNTNTRSEMHEKDFYIFALSHVDTIGCETIKKLIDAGILIDDLKKLSYDGLKSELQLQDIQASGIIRMLQDMKEIDDEYSILLKSNIRYITYMNPCYPGRLKKIRQFPAAVFAYGQLPPDNVPSVAIVGSRACTGYGAAVAEHLGEVLAQHGVSVISGMAVGIDSAAHKGALKAIAGKTYAVLGGGVNVVYPKENRYIYDEIVTGQRGGIISEYLPGAAAISRNFPMRNRIVSGLSDIVIVVEAREKSGSLLTADYAKKQGKDIMAVPGRITDPMSSGTNRLISEGVKIVNSPEDVLKILSINIKPGLNKNNQKIKALDNDEKIVYSTLVSDPKHIEIIAHETGLSGSAVLNALVSLELKGLADQVSSNYYISM